MKLTNKEVLNIHETLTIIGNKEMDCVLSVKIARNNQKLMELACPVYEERNKLAEKYGKRDAKGELATNAEGNVILEKSGEYMAELKALMEAPCEAEISRFTMEEIKKMSPTANQIMFLFPVITEK